MPRADSSPHGVGAEIGALVGVTLLAVATRMRPLRSPDLLWQLREGEQILASGRRLATDGYSFWFRGRPLLDHVWGFEAVAARLHRAGGMPVLWWSSLVVAIVLLAASLRAARALVPAVLPRVVAISLAAFALAGRLELAPEMVPAMMLTLAHALRRDAARAPLRFAPLACAAIAAPFHASALLIAIVPLLHAVVAGARARDREAAREVTIDLAIACASVAMVEWVTPGALAFVKASRAAASFDRHLLEMGFPLRHVIATGDVAPLLAMALSLLAVVGLVRAVREGKAHATDALLVAVLALPGPLGARYAMLPLLAALPWVVAGLATLVAPSTARVGRPIAMASAALALASSAYAVTSDLGLTDVIGFDWATQPVTAVSYLRYHHPNASLFHAYNFGAYLIHADYPPRGVVIDPRGAMLYPDDFAARYYRAIADPGEFEAWAATAPFDVVLLSRAHVGSRALRTHLYMSPAWTQVWYDHIAVVFIRTRLVK